MYQSQTPEARKAYMAEYRLRRPGLAASHNKAYRLRHGPRALRMKREAEQRRKYGESAGELRVRLMSKQGNICAICDGPPGDKHGILCMDHCHVSGRVIGLLCGTCNSAIGLLMEDPNIIRRAADYVDGRKL